ncbi:probable cytochrome P450 304a1 [Schistocerca cancellata]|uniref:probable cytochrome P450 304a1 n=1 Tax=Schistocerca cancellata TaxID=274614 RepID=UPI002118E56A|nr:probable cytochrome P450 304a1 [Schistocerca cancellata]
MLTLFLVAAVVVLLFLLCRELLAWPENFPPGPCRLPVWGSYWWLVLRDRRRIPAALRRLSADYRTSTLGLFLGPLPAVYVTDEASIRQLLSRPEFQGRQTTVLSDTRTFGRNLVFDLASAGVSLANEPAWRRHRRFSLSQLRDLGFGRRFQPLELETAAEVSDLLDLMAGRRHDQKLGVIQSGTYNLLHCLLSRVQHQSEMSDPHAAVQSVRRPCDGAVLFPDATYRCFAAVTWSLFAGSRPGRASDRQLLLLGRRGRQNVLATDGTGNAIVQTPWLRHLSPGQFGLADFVQGHNALIDYVKQTFDEQLATYSEEHTRHFLDVCIKEMKKDAADQGLPFDIGQVIATGTDLLLPSLTVTTTALAEAVRCLVLHPEVQTKVHLEIDSVVGRGRLPTLDDRPNLPYFEATIREALRRKTAVPLSVAHASTAEATLNGYTLPKGTILLPGLEAFHMNPEVWGDPENFRPERFLDETGKLLPDRTLPFGGGRRECFGKTYARNSLFLFLGGMLQSFILQQPQSEKPLTLDGLYSKNFTNQVQHITFYCTSAKCNL